MVYVGRASAGHTHTDRRKFCPGPLSLEPTRLGLWTFFTERAVSHTVSTRTLGPMSYNGEIQADNTKDVIFYDLVRKTSAHSRRLRYSLFLSVGANRK